jgi:hypothetical protein
MEPSMARRTTSFRAGRIRAVLRGRVWHLTHHEQGRRIRPRVGTDAAVARQLAAQINAELERCAPTAPNFEPITIVERAEPSADSRHVP